MSYTTTLLWEGSEGSDILVGVTAFCILILGWYCANLGGSFNAGNYGLLSLISDRWLKLFLLLLNLVRGYPLCARSLIVEFNVARTSDSEGESLL